MTGSMLADIVIVMLFIIFVLGLVALWARE